MCLGNAVYISISIYSISNNIQITTCFSSFTIISSISGIHCIFMDTMYKTIFWNELLFRFFVWLARRELLFTLLLRVVNCNVWCPLQCKENLNRPGWPGVAGTTWKTPLEYQESTGQSPCWQFLFKMTSWSCQGIPCLPHPFFLQTLEMGIYGSNEKPCKPQKHGWLILMSVWFHHPRSTLVGTGVPDRLDSDPSWPRWSALSL